MDDELERIEGAVRAQVSALVAAGSPGQVRRVQQERIPRVLRAPRIVEHELEPVWDVGELLVNAVAHTAGDFTDEVLMMHMGVSANGELLSVSQPLERTTHYSYASVSEARKALSALEAVAHAYGVPALDSDDGPDDGSGPT